MSSYFLLLELQIEGCRDSGKIVFKLSMLVFDWQIVMLDF